MKNYLINQTNSLIDDTRQLFCLKPRQVSNEAPDLKGPLFTWTYNKYHLSCCPTKDETFDFLWNWGASIDPDLDSVTKFPGLWALWTENHKVKENKIWYRRQMGWVGDSAFEKSYSNAAAGAITAGVFTAGTLVMLPFIVVGAAALVTFVGGFYVLISLLF